MKKVKEDTNSKVLQKSGRCGRPRVPKFNPEIDDHISFLQVIYGKYDRRYPVMERVWVYEKYSFSILKDEARAEAFYDHPKCDRRVCGTVVFETRSKKELAELEKLKAKEYRLALNRLTGMNYFTVRPNKEDMITFINSAMLEKKRIHRTKNIKKVKYIIEMVKIETLRPNFLVSEVEIPVNKVYSELAHLLQYYDKPVVSDDNIVLSHWECVLSAKENQLEEIEVVRAVGLDSNYYVPFISFDYVFKEKSILFRYRHLKALRDFIKTNPVGEKWRGNTPVNDLLAKVMGVDIETIKLYNRIVKRTVEIGKPEDYFFKLDLPITKILPEIERLKTSPDNPNPESGVNINPPNQTPHPPLLGDLQPRFSEKHLQLVVNNKVVEFVASEAAIRGNKAVYQLSQHDGGSKAIGQLILPLSLIGSV